jgi:hypothetical protein
MIKPQLEHIRDHKRLWRACQMKASSELDLVRSITHNKHSDVSFEQSSSAWLHKPIPYSALQSSKPSEYQHSTMIPILDEAVRASDYKQSWDSYQLAFEENGLVFFTPFTTKVGDLVCQFPQSDVLATLSFNNKHCYKTCHNIPSSQFFHLSA